MPDPLPPILEIADDDPGDDVQRRFRYQHAFGVILLIAAIRQENDYISLWCEHHEDFLAETSDGKFDAYQVKTNDTGTPWQVNHESFYSSIKRFSKLDGLANGSIRRFTFATNAKPFESGVADKAHLCPLRLLKGIASAADDPASVNGSIGRALTLLAKKTELPEDSIFRTLKKTTFVTSLPLDGFESLLAHEHLANYAPCKHLAATFLSRIVERLISIVFQSSSLSVADPARHYAPLTFGAALTEALRAKCVTPHAVALAVKEAASPAFHYLAGLNSLQPSSPESWAILKRKMEHGGISSFFDLLYRRAISAEANLLALDQSTDVVNQVESFVADQCDEIRLKYNNLADPCGDRMLLEIIERFEALTREHPLRTFHQAPETLVGVAGLLAGDCKVWLSKPFDLKNPIT